MQSQHVNSSGSRQTHRAAPNPTIRELLNSNSNGTRVADMFRMVVITFAAGFFGGLQLAANLAAQDLPGTGSGQTHSQTGSQPRVSARFIFEPSSEPESGNVGAEQEPVAGSEPQELPHSRPERNAPTVIEDPLARLRNASDEVTSDYQNFETPSLLPRRTGVQVASRSDDVAQQPERPSAFLASDVWPNEGYEYLGESRNLEQLEGLRTKVRRTLQYYQQRPETTLDYSPWGVMHALIAYGVETQVNNGRQRVNAIGWLCWNGTCRGQKLLSARNGQLRPLVGPGLQGHEGQFLAMLAQCYVPDTHELRVDGHNFTVRDLIEVEQRSCRPGTELTFKLIGFSHYLPTDSTWVSSDGEHWDMERLIEEEISQPVIGAACGGTHRLMGLSFAVRNRRLAGLPVDGQWARAEQYIRDYQQYAISLQNPDGSFSTKWLERREARTDSQRRIQTTGHILEWMIYSLPEERLRSPEVVKTVNYLADLMWSERNTKWEIGPKGHALHALNMYEQRVFGAPMGRGIARTE